VFTPAVFVPAPGGAASANRFQVSSIVKDEIRREVDQIINS
jgi:hypothetical protein